MYTSLKSSTFKIESLKIILRTIKGNTSENNNVIIYWFFLIKGLIDTK